MTKVLYERPPVWNEIARRFPMVGRRQLRGVLFSWGPGLIYNPDRVEIPGCLFAHEAAHGRRQDGDIEGWWDRYLDDPEFRLAEEIIGHRAELRHLIEGGMNRQQRRGTARAIAHRLSGPLYGSLISQKKALAAITA